MSKAVDYTHSNSFPHKLYLLTLLHPQAQLAPLGTGPLGIQAVCPGSLVRHKGCWLLSLHHVSGVIFY